MTYLLACKKPEDGPPPGYRDTLLKTRGWTEGWTDGLTQILIYLLIYLVSIFGYISFISIIACIYIYRSSRDVLHAWWKPSLGAMAPDQVIGVPTITTASQNFGRQIDWDSDTQNKILKTRLFMCYMTTNIVHTVNNHT